MKLGGVQADALSCFVHGMNAVDALAAAGPEDRFVVQDVNSSWLEGCFESGVLPQVTITSSFLLGADLRPLLALVPTPPQLLVGTFNRTLDDKYRVAIPAEFQEAFRDQGVYLTLGPCRSLWLFPGPEFRRILTELRNAVAGDASARELKQYFTNNSYEVMPDNSGRFVIPEPLRSILCGSEPPKIDAPREIIFRGSGNFIEICLPFPA